MSESENLPARHNGFDDEEDSSIWRGPRIKFNEGMHKWPDGTAVSPDAEFIATDTITIISRFKDKKLIGQPIIEEPGEEPRDLDAMNAEIPKAEWGTGFNGEPQEPFQRQRLLYLLNELDAGEATFITPSGGGRVAISELKNKVRRMRQLRGEDVFPVIRLRSAPWKTRYGMKTRPDFEIVRWVSLGPKAPQIEQTKPVAPTAAAVGKTTTAEKKGKLREVKPPSLAEEMDDEIPF